jgi:hypothetical protein
MAQALALAAQLVATLALLVVPCVALLLVTLAVRAKPGVSLARARRRGASRKHL